ncbi:MAG TPA: hypothetical protein VF453_12730, partial [Burkholderiaceae bacterium]
GLAGVAGGVVPVYDLGVLAGYPPGDRPSWMAVCAAAPVALAFDAFDGQVSHAGATREAVAAGAVLRIAGEARPLIDVGALIERVRASIPSSTPPSTSSPTAAAAADREN